LRPTQNITDDYSEKTKKSHGKKENKKKVRTFPVAYLLNDFGSDIISSLRQLVLTIVLVAHGKRNESF